MSGRLLLLLEGELSLDLIDKGVDLCGERENFNLFSSNSILDGVSELCVKIKY